MSTKEGSFQANIHDESYLERYREGRADWTSAVFDAGRDKEALDGVWRFTIDPYDTCLRARWYLEQAASPQGLRYPLDYDFDAWETVRVPSCWNLQRPELFWYEGPAVYTRTFTYKNRGEKRVVLKFGGANYQTRVFLNQKYAGGHQGGSTPFFLDVTELLRDDNRLLVVVDSTRRPLQVPMTNTDWFNYGGLYRSVELLRLPETAIEEFTAALVPRTLDQIRVALRVTGEVSGSARVRIPELSVDVEIAVSKGRGETTLLAFPEPWSPDRPRLYEILVSFGTDEVSDRIGFRDIHVEGGQIVLNGAPLFLKGISIHEESLANGKAVTDDEIRENFALVKELGGNFARLAHYPHSERAARIADEVGLLLWEEIPVYWAIAFEQPATLEDAKNQLAELIVRDRNRASVILWSVGNENPDSDARLSFMTELARTARRLDPTRLVTAACLVDRVNLRIDDRLAEALDVIGINEYYGWYEPDIADLKRLFDNSRPEKPVIISEFGADARAGHRGSSDDLWTEDKQLAVYRTQTQTIASIPYIRGMTPWILYDFRCPRRTNGLQEFYNRKGLLSEDKNVRKLAFGCLRDFYKSR